MVSRTDASGTTYPLRDALGSVIALTDSVGAIQTSYSYDAFGGSSTSGAASGNTAKYTGREDDGTGLYYYRARYYSPRLQRFISEDPIGLAGGINQYTYVANNPISSSDPSGLKPADMGDGSPTMGGVDKSNPYLNNPGRKPPGWNEGWPTGKDGRGGYSENPDTGRRYWPHNEDGRHWDHYDWKDPGGKEGSYPEKSEKPRQGQKRPPYGNQSGEDPWPAPAPQPEPAKPKPGPTAEEMRLLEEYYRLQEETWAHTLKWTIIGGGLYLAAPAAPIVFGKPVPVP